MNAERLKYVRHVLSGYSWLLERTATVLRCRCLRIYSRHPRLCQNVLVESLSSCQEQIAGRIELVSSTGEPVQ
ncbi:hypothetical protein OH77DRAFT_43618 [Trametes cingulata]|nr:hypothetical protein OH77DRAFT_43618 [Trametes cingulata]